MQSAEIALATPDFDPKEFLVPYAMLRMKNVAIARPGDFTDMNGNGVKFGVTKGEDSISLTDLAANFGKEGQHVPRVHLGHPDRWQGEQPTHAEVERLHFDGKYLRADYKNVPLFTARQFLTTGAYPNRSLEMKRINGEWRLTAVGQLGSSMPAIEGLPPISLKDCEWMDSEEFKFSGNPDDCIFGLRSPQPDTEVSMTDNPNPSGATGGADIAALQAQHEDQMRKLQAEFDAKLAAAAQKAREEAEAKYGADIAEMKFANAQGEVNSFCNELRQNSKATTAQFENGKLADILLHARLNCPDMKLADGSSVSMFSAIKAVLEMNVSGPTMHAGRSFSAEGAGNAPAAPSGKANSDKADRVRKYMAEHNCDWDTAVRQLASASRGGK